MTFLNKKNKWEIKSYFSFKQRKYVEDWRGMFIFLNKNSMYKTKKDKKN